MTTWDLGYRHHQTCQYNSEFLLKESGRSHSPCSLKFPFDLPVGTARTLLYISGRPLQFSKFNDYNILKQVGALQSSMRAEGKLLASTPYGARILEVLGRVYSLQAEMVLGGNSNQKNPICTLQCISSIAKTGVENL